MGMGLSIEVMPFSPELLEKAKEAWIAYSTPLWRRAGRSEEWIAQNIIDEWATSQDDIVRRYLAGDFTLPIGEVPEWLSKYWPVLVVGGIGATLLTFWWIKKK